MSLLPMVNPFSLHRSLSLFQLILLGFAVVAIPLSIVLVTSLLSLDRLTSQSRQAVLGAVNAIQSSRTVVEDITAMERHARQYHVLGDRALLDVYDTRRDSFVEAIGRMQQLDLAANAADRVRLMVELDRHLLRVLHEETAESEALRLALEEFSELNSLARGVFQESTRAVSREVERMQDDALAMRSRLLWQASTVIPAVLLLAAIFSVLIARPLLELKRVIRSLGDGHFDQPIQVNGSHDLSDLGRRLDWLRSRLVELENQKLTFLRHISHELKTPLTNIREGAELLSDEVVGPLNPQQQEISEIVRHNSVQLQRLIEDLLSFNMAQTAMPLITPRPIALAGLINDIVEQHQLAARAHRIRFELKLHGGTLNTDTEKLRVILDNLLSNAVKFAPTDSRVLIHTHQEAEHLTVDICDEGPGIVEAEREQVFEAFYQGQMRAHGHLRGSGLGLSIAREYTRALGGQLSILNSTRGAHFRLSLPRSGQAPLPSPDEIP